MDTANQGEGVGYTTEALIASHTSINEQEQPIFEELDSPKEMPPVFSDPSIGIKSSQSLGQGFETRLQEQR